MKLRQVGGSGTTTNLSLSDEAWGENKNQGAPKSNVIKLRGTSKSPCIRNGAGGIFFQKRVDIKAEKCGRFRY